MIQTQEIVFTHASIVTPHEVFRGSLKVEEGRIKAIDRGGCSAPGAVDLEGDYLLPGLIEMHTDNLEKHLVPRPGVIWPSTMAALIAHDTQISGAGITTVLDAVFVGEYREGGARREILSQSINALQDAQRSRLLRADHMLHMRCELSDKQVLGMFEPYVDDPLVRLVSLMDHTPGQRQWSDLSKWRLFHRDKKWTDRDFEEILAERVQTQRLYAEEHRSRILSLCRKRKIPVASHDDTTEQHAFESKRDGVTISEFPTTLVAAQRARQFGIHIVMGAPNVVRGNSHSGNVSALELACGGFLDGLSSDYFPLSLLHAPFVLNKRLNVPLPEAVAKVSSNIADFLGLGDRGHVQIGKRADLVRVKMCDDLPVAVATYRDGRRIH